jgi:hypothetical protein
VGIPGTSTHRVPRSRRSFEGNDYGRLHRFVEPGST